MDAMAITVLVDRDGAGSGEVFSSRISNCRLDTAADFNGLRWLVVEPTMEAIVAVRANAVRRMDQLPHSGKTI